MKIGNAAGFWGDDIDAARRTLKNAPDLDYLNFDYLAEMSMSIMAIQREKDPGMGYAADFIEVVRSLVPYWKGGGKCKLITNGGGLNPRGLAEACRKTLLEHDLNLKIGVIEGDNVLPILLKNPNDPLFNHLETKAALSSQGLVTANAYLGAAPIAQALDLGAHIVISGRIADPSLTVGPCIHHFKWSLKDHHQLAGATIAGHLIECGTQVTGGISTDWLSLPHIESIGYPIAEIDETGACIMTKPLQSGGLVSVQTVKEQLLYEIFDPAEYKSPDVTVSFLGLEVKELSDNRVLVHGAIGMPPPPYYKVSGTYRAGYRCEGTLALFGENLIQKAKKMEAMIVERLREANFTLEKLYVETIGCGSVVPGCGTFSSSYEGLIRFAALDPRKEALEYFAKQIAPLVTSGPQGVTGYTSGRPNVRPVFGFWPCLIERELVKENIEVL